MISLKFRLAIAIMAFSFSLCMAQDVESKVNKYVIEELYGSTFAEDGDIISVGYARNGNTGGESNYFLIMRTHPNGDTLWVKTFGWEGSNFANGVIRTLDGNFVFAGSYSDATFKSEAVWGKFDQNGDTLWTKKSGISVRNETSFISEDQQGNLYLGGSAYSEANASMDLLLIKTNSDGDTLWTRTTGSPQPDFASAMKKVSDGVVLTGYSLVVHFGSSGDIIFNKEPQIKGAMLSFITGIELTKDGNYIAACSTYYQNEGFFLTLIKLDQNGDTLWTKLHKDYNRTTYNLTTAYDSNFVSVGYVYSEGSQSAVIFKIDQNGEILWTKELSGAPYNISRSPDGYFVVSGAYRYGQPSNISDTYLLIEKDDSAPIVNAVASGTSNNRFQVYPNPSSGLMYISSDLKLDGSEITITNMQGVVVHRTLLTAQKNMLEGSGLDNGVYHLNVKQGDSNHHELIVIQK